MRLVESVPGITSPDPEKGGEMNDTRMNNAHGSDDRLPVGGAGGTTRGWPAEVAGGPAAAAVAPSSRPASDPAGSVAPLPAQRRSGRGPDGTVPLRLVQVYLTPVIDEFLRQARSMAIVQGLDVSASAVVRHAMERLIVVASPAEIVELLGGPKGQSQHRRGRPRRLMRSAFSNLCMHNSEKGSALLLAWH